jgi:hypothetical protein
MIWEGGGGWGGECESLNNMGVAKQASAYVNKFMIGEDFFLKPYKTTEHMHVNSISF